MRSVLRMTLLALVLAACATAEKPPAEVKVDKRIYVANESSNTVTVIDALTLAPIKTIPMGLSGTHDLALTRDGRKLFVSNLLSGAVAVVDTATLEVVATIPTGNRCHSLALSNDESQLWVVNIGENNVSVSTSPACACWGRFPSAACPVTCASPRTAVSPT